MEITLEITFCPSCYSQVRLNDGQYIGYNEECVCIEGLEKKEVISFSVPAEKLKKVYGFVMRENNTLVTYFEAVEMRFELVGTPSITEPV